MLALRRITESDAPNERGDLLRKEARYQPYYFSKDKGFLNKHHSGSHEFLVSRFAMRKSAPDLLHSSLATYRVPCRKRRMR